MVWLPHAFLLIIALVYLIESVRMTGQLRNIGVWLPILILGGCGMFGGYIWLKLRADCTPYSPMLSSDFDTQKRGDQLRLLKQMRSGVSEQLAECSGEESQGWLMYERIGEMIDVLEGVEAQSALGIFSEDDP